MCLLSFNVSMSGWSYFLLQCQLERQPADDCKPIPLKRLVVRIGWLCDELPCCLVFNVTEEKRNRGWNRSRKWALPSQKVWAQWKSAWLGITLIQAVGWRPHQRQIFSWLSSLQYCIISFTPFPTLAFPMIFHVFSKGCKNSSKEIEVKGRKEYLAIFSPQYINT